jgi:hypothetical protein
LTESCEAGGGGDVPVRAVSVVEGAGSAVLADNTVDRAKRVRSSAIRWSEAATGDLATAVQPSRIRRLRAIM